MKKSCWGPGWGWQGGGERALLPEAPQGCPPGFSPTPTPPPALAPQLGPGSPHHRAPPAIPYPSPGLHSTLIGLCPSPDVPCVVPSLNPCCALCHHRPVTYLFSPSVSCPARGGLTEITQVKPSAQAWDAGNVCGAVSLLSLPATSPASRPISVTSTPTTSHGRHHPLWALSVPLTAVSCWLQAGSPQGSSRGKDGWCLGNTYW